MKNFKFKSDRKYLHGTDIYDYFIKKNFKDIKIIFKKKITHQPYIIKSHDEKNLKNKLCSIEYSHNGVFFSINLKNSKKKISKSYKYDESKMYKYFKLSGTLASCNFKSNFTSIETLISLNKYYHNEKIELKDWYLSKLKLSKSLDDNIFKKYTLKIKKNILNKFTITDIYKNSKKLGQIEFISYD